MYIPILTLDVETVPSVCPTEHARIAESITPPATMSRAETIAEWETAKKPTLVHEAILKTAFDGSRGSLCVLGAAINDEDPVAFWKPGTRPHEHEAEILKEFFYFIKGAGPSLFVGHNIEGFDLLFILQRAIILGVQPPTNFPIHQSHGSQWVFDNMIHFAGRGGRISQDRLARLLGLPGKQGMDGSQVWPAVCAGRIEDVASYCKDGDVQQARGIYKRLTFQL